MYGIYHESSNHLKLRIYCFCFQLDGKRKKRSNSLNEAENNKCTSENESGNLAYYII